jgi:hypothetical protein
MTLPEHGYLLHIFIGESDRNEGQLIYEWGSSQSARSGPRASNYDPRHDGLWCA